MTSFLDFSEELAQVVARAEASVVGVHGRRSCGASGVVWAPNLVVTQARAFEREDRFEVRTAGARYSAERVGAHPPSDLLVLRVDAELTALASEVPDRLRVGNVTLALGRPGEHVRARFGVLSALGTGEWRLPGGMRVERYIETDIGPAPGFSGGALVSARGWLIGVASSGITRGTLVALPPGSVSRMVESLAAHGRVKKAYLGVSVHAVRLPPRLRDRLQGQVGLIVLSVEGDSPAERAGLLLGDVLVGLDQSPLARIDDLEAALNEAAIGSEFSLDVVRAGEHRKISVRAQERRFSDDSA